MFFYCFQNPFGLADARAAFIAVTSSGDISSTPYWSFGASSGLLPLGYIITFPWECLFTPKLIVSFSKSYTWYKCLKRVSPTTKRFPLEPFIWFSWIANWHLLPSAWWRYCSAGSSKVCPEIYSWIGPRSFLISSHGFITWQKLSSSMQFNFGTAAFHFSFKKPNTFSGTPIAELPVSMIAGKFFSSPIFWHSSPA